MKVTVTLEFDSALDAAEALAKMSGVVATADRPDAGQEAPADFNPFAKGAAVVPSPPPVPSTAAVAAPPTAPATSTVATPPAPAAPPASVAPAPTAPAAPSAPALGVTLDSKGLPWDARIHAETKTQNKDGSWRSKRNLDAAFMATVEAELRSALALNSAAAPAPAPAATVAAPPAPAVPTAPAEPSGVTFGQLMERLSPAMMSAKITPAKVTEVLAKHGINGLGMLAVAPNLVPAVAADFEPLLA